MVCFGPALVFAILELAFGQQSTCSSRGLVQKAFHRVKRQEEALTVQECPPPHLGASVCEAEAKHLGFPNATDAGVPDACFLWHEKGNITMADIQDSVSSKLMDVLVSRCQGCVAPMGGCNASTGVSCYQSVESGPLAYFAQCHRNCPKNESWTCAVFWDTPDQVASAASGEQLELQKQINLLAEEDDIGEDDLGEDDDVQPLGEDPELSDGESLREPPAMIPASPSPSARSLLSYRTGVGSSYCWGSVVDSALCGFKTVTDGAICGWNEGKKCKYGRRRRWSGFKGCNFWKIPKSCSAPASCDVALDVPSCLQDLIGSAVQSQYRTYAKFITNTGCSSVSSCKGQVTGGLNEAWHVVYDTMQSAQSGIGSMIARGTHKFGQTAPALVAKAKESRATLRRGLNTATAEMRSYFGGTFGQFQKHDLGQVCTPPGVGFWYLVPTDCGFFAKFGDIFSSPSSAESSWNSAVERLRECVMKTGAFAFPTPFLDFRVNSFCLPHEVQTPIEYILGVFKFASSSGASLINHFESIAAKIQGLISSVGLNFNEIGRQVKQRRLALNSASTVAKAASASWPRCACEGKGHPTNPDCVLSSTCSCNGIVRYGYGDRWNVKEVSGSVQCTNSVFGDPFSGQGKECQCVERSEIKWSRCACQEKGHPKNPDCLLSNVCSCDGMVRYGYGDKWNEKAISGSTQCAASVFGDPYPGQAKECHCMGRHSAEDDKPESFGLQVSACFDWSFLAYSVSLCVGLLFGRKDGATIPPNLMMDVEFGASSFAQSSLEEKPPETGFSLLFDYKEEYPAFLPASEPRWGVSGTVDVQLDTELEGLAEVGAGVGVSFLPDPEAAKGYALTLALGQDDAGEEAEGPACDDFVALQTNKPRGWRNLWPHWPKRRRGRLRAPVIPANLPTDPRDGEKSNQCNWGGVNSFFLHALPESSQHQILESLQKYGLKTVRIFVAAVPANFKHSGSRALPHFEPETWGVYDYTVLESIDRLMVKVKSYGIKLVIALHDRYALGCHSCDAYQKELKLVCLPDRYPYTPCSAENQATKFYENATATAYFDQRLKKILEHNNTLLNQTWGNLKEVVFMFEMQNEAQGLDYIKVSGWHCARAKQMRKFMDPAILIGTGGGRTFESSTPEELFACPEIDVVALHDYDASTYDEIWWGLAAARDLGIQFGKYVLHEEFGRTQKLARPDYFYAVISAANTLGIPYMPWEYVIPGNNDNQDYEWDERQASWPVLVFETMIANQTKGSFFWNTLDLCSA